MFEYSAVDAESEETTGKIEATTQVDAINKLKSQGLWPKQVIEESKRKLRASKNDRKKNRSRYKSQSKSKGYNILSSVLVGGGALGIVLYFVFSNQFTKKSKIIEAIKVNDPPVISELLSPVADAKPELEGVNYDELEEREGIRYLKGSGNPYTGKTFVLHENGQKKGEGAYKDGKKDGLWLEWYSNGQKMWKINYKNDKLDGLLLRWHENGQKSWEGNWKDGKEISTKYWNSKGEPVDSQEEAYKK